MHDKRHWLKDWGFCPDRGWISEKLIAFTEKRGPNSNDARAHAEPRSLCELCEFESPCCTHAPPRLFSALLTRVYSS